MSMASTFTLKSQAYNTRYLYVTCEQIKNIEANTSTINWTLTVTGGNANNYSTGPTTLMIGGQQAYYIERKAYTTKQFPAARGSVSGSVVIPHDVNGKATITVSLSTAIFTATVSTQSDTWELDEIPRKATITSASNFNDENINPKITYTNLAGSAVDSLRVFISLDGAGALVDRELDKLGNTYTIELTEEEQEILRAASIISGKAHCPMYIKLNTYIGRNTFSDMKEVVYEVVNAEPILEPTAVDTSTITTGLTGNPNSLIKGYNSFAVACNATAQKGAEIVSYRISNGAKFIETASGKLDYCESNTFVFVVTDNRGLTTTKTLTLPMVNYIKATCNLEAKIELVNEDNAKIILNISGNYFNGSFGAKDNTLAVKYAIKANNGDYGNWVILNTQPTLRNGTYSITHEITGLVYTNSYTVKAAAYDLIGGRETSGITLQTIPIFEWGESDFKFNVPVYLGKVELDYIVEQGDKDGWSYRKWNSGRGEAWKNLTLTTDATTSWGNMWRGNLTDRQSYPFAFVARPVEQISLQCGNYGAFILPADGNDGVNGTYASARYTVCRPASTSSGTYYLAYYVSGKWK